MLASMSWNAFAFRLQIYKISVKKHVFTRENCESSLTYREHVIFGQKMLYFSRKKDYIFAIKLWG